MNIGMGNFIIPIKTLDSLNQTLSIDTKKFTFFFDDIAQNSKFTAGVYRVTTFNHQPVIVLRCSLRDLLIILALQDNCSISR